MLKFLFYAGDLAIAGGNLTIDFCNEFVIFVLNYLLLRYNSHDKIALCLGKIYIAAKEELRSGY
jgi:hypothetical protein